MTKEFEFFIKSNLDKYKGKYIAIIGNKVVASDSNAKKVWQIAKKKMSKETSYSSQTSDQELAGV